MDLAQERGASNWLTSLPLQEFGFTLHKGAFRDAIALRYGWQPSLVPSTCACGSNFSVEHALSCPKGGFPIIRHNEVRDFTANLLSEVCHDVCVEPTLQPITGEVLMLAQDWTSQLMASGAALRSVPFLMWEFLTLMLHQIGNLYQPASESTRMRRNGPMNKEYVKLNTAPLLLWSCLLLVVLVMLPLSALSA